MKLLRNTALAFSLIFSQQALADIEAGDISLRSDIQLLADWNLISGPTSAWPLPSNTVTELKKSLSVEQNKLPAFVVSAAKRLTQKQAQYKATLGVGNKLKNITGFQARNRTDAELTLRGQWEAGRWAATGAITVSEDRTQLDAKHNDKVRFDGSSASVQLGNWRTTIGRQDRWWGPSWHGSLILSNNARPIPTISIQRENTDAFETPWLSWLGPWQLTTAFGQLESDRHIPNALFFGMRATIKPAKNFSLGLSRTAVWGGKGRPNDLETFYHLFTGNDNGDGGLSADEEPGNQLGGFDMRYNFFVGQTGISIYSQFIGEDEAGGLPSRFVGQAGSSVNWGDSQGTLYRVIVEYTDTTAGLGNAETYLNTTYRHHLYRSGYIYRGNSIGHSIDQDSRAYSAQLLVTPPSGNNYGVKVAAVDINRDNTNRDDVPHLISEDAITILAADLFANFTLADDWTMQATLFTEQGEKDFDDQTGFNLKLGYSW